MELSTSKYADPYVYQGTGVLINKLEIRDEAAFKKFEYQSTDFRTQELHKQELPARFDLAHLKSVHAHLFKDVYQWAGQTRTIESSKGGATYERVQNIETTGARISDRLQAQNNLQGLDKRQFVEKFSVLYADLNALHPFREGNGRATREFIGQVARNAGYELDQTRIDNNKNQWNKAAAQSVHGDLAGIKEIFSQAVRPSQAVAFENLPRDAALQKHPELQGTYTALDAMQKTLQNRHPGNQRAQDHFLAHARTEAVRKLDQGAGAAPQRELKQPGAAAMQRTEASSSPVTGSTLSNGSAKKAESTPVKSTAIDKTSAYQLSLTAIDDMAKAQGLTPNDPAKIGTSFKGVVVGVTDHHTLIKTTEGVGVRHDNVGFSRPLKVGDRVKLDLDPTREITRGAQSIEGRSAGQAVKATAGREIDFQKN